MDRNSRCPRRAPPRHSTDGRSERPRTRSVVEEAPKAPCRTLERFLPPALLLALHGLIVEHTAAEAAAPRPTTPGHSSATGAARPSLEAAPKTLRARLRPLLQGSFTVTLRRAGRRRTCTGSSTESGYLKTGISQNPMRR